MQIHWRLILKVKRQGGSCKRDFHCGATSADTSPISFNKTGHIIQISLDNLLQTGSNSLLRKGIGRKKGSKEKNDAEQWEALGVMSELFLNSLRRIPEGSR